MSQDKNSTSSSSLQQRIIRLSKIHYVFIAFIAIQTIVFDAWNLVTPYIVLNRWVSIGILFLATTAIWYLAGDKHINMSKLRSSVWAMVIIDILFASYFVFLQRGVASKAVVFFALAIISAAALMNARALMATAAIAATGYVISSVMYFVLNFNEAFKVELYGEVTFYAALMFVLAKLVEVISLKPSS